VGLVLGLPPTLPPHCGRPQALGLCPDLVSRAGPHQTAPGSPVHGHHGCPSPTSLPATSPSPHRPPLILLHLNAAAVRLAASPALLPPARQLPPRPPLMVPSLRSQIGHRAIKRRFQVAKLQVCSSCSRMHSRVAGSQPAVAVVGLVGKGHTRAHPLCWHPSCRGARRWRRWRRRRRRGLPPAPSRQLRALIRQLGIRKALPLKALQQR